MTEVLVVQRTRRSPNTENDELGSTFFTIDDACIYFPALPPFPATALLKPFHLACICTELYLHSQSVARASYPIQSGWRTEIRLSNHGNRNV